MISKFIKSFQSKYKPNDGGKRSSQDHKLSEIGKMEPKDTSRMDSSSSMMSMRTSNIGRNAPVQQISIKPLDVKKRRLSIQLVDRSDAEQFLKTKPPSKWLLYPESQFITFWDLLMTITLLFTSIFRPYQVAFSR